MGASLALFCAQTHAQLVAGGVGAALRLTATLEKLVEESGPDGAVRYELTPGSLPEPGDQFVLTVRFANVSAATTDGVRITSALPAGMRYVAGSATGPGGLVLFSTDDGRTFGTEREVAGQAAAGANDAAQTVRYTHVRWVLEAPLEPGTTGFVRLRLTQS
jgi:uncharacterized repeat protein (TIGR01451 family)